MLFHYNTLIVKLFPLTKSLKVYLNQEYINKEMLFELEGLFSWLGNHIEVSSVYLSSTGSIFSKGFNNEDIKNSESEKFQSYLERIQKLTHSMCYLPQTFIVDIKQGAFSEASEIILGADIIIANEKSSLTFNHLVQGRIPQSGGIGLLNSKVGHSRAQSWVMLGKEVKINELISSGLIYKTYNEDDKNPETELLETISNQSQISRIQAKRALLESVIGQMENSKIYESIFAKAAISVEDWKEYLRAEKENKKPEYKRARDISITNETKA